jgi:excisionase family DNA binding protein
MMLKPKQVAEALGVTPASVLKLIAAGKLQAINVACGNGRATWRIDADEVNRFKRLGANVVPRKEGRWV